MDIIIFAAIAIFILYKLYTVLGQDIGFKADKVMDMEDIDLEKKPVFHKKTTLKQVHEQDLAKIQELQPEFNHEEFLDGAAEAFKMILNALNTGDRQSLEFLLTPDLYKVFEKVIVTREKNHETWENELIRIQSAEITQTEIQRDNQIFVTVKFISEQILSILDKGGNLIDGDPNQIEIITDIWTFTRNASSQDPNWFLSKTTHGND